MAEITGVNAAVDVVMEENRLVLRTSGQWTSRCCDDAAAILETLHGNDVDVFFDLTQIRQMDTVGALLIQRTASRLRRESHVEIRQASQRHAELLAMVERYGRDETPLEAPRESTVCAIGSEALALFKNIYGMLAFFGETFVATCRQVSNPRQIRWRELMFHINESAVKSLWIIALTMFLVGIVVAYQSAVQLKTYGANIFIVDMLGISMLRELGPMLAAIVVAGRSGSAFAAQIGVMKITEELDAMRTMGFDPFVFLVIPRMLALMMMMPVLIFFADLFGVLGGMVVANVQLDLSVFLFIERFSQTVAVEHFIVGVIKGPFFAILIASIGIYRGLQVKNDTESIGFNTTRSVVESIFAVIICDAVFSVIFTHLGF